MKVEVELEKLPYFQRLKLTQPDKLKELTNKGGQTNKLKWEIKRGKKKEKDSRTSSP